MWPIRFPLFQDELLSTWLGRNAFAMDVSPLTLFLDLRIDDRHSQLSYIDYLISPPLAHHLHARSGTSMQSLSNATVSRFSSLVFHELRMRRRGPWLVPARLTASYNGRGYCVCRACLSDDEMPYYRVSWMLALTTICDRHKCILHDQCAECGASIFPWGESFARSCKARCFCCYRCGADFRQQPTSTVEPISDGSWASTQRLLTVLNEYPGGILSSSGLTPDQRSIEFFDILYELIYLFFARSKHGRLIRMAEKDVGSTVFELNMQGRQFELLSPAHRFEILRLCMTMIDPWPNRLVNVFSAAEKISPFFKSDYLHRPEWLTIPSSSNSP